MFSREFLLNDGDILTLIFITARYYRSRLILKYRIIENWMKSRNMKYSDSVANYL